MDNHHYSSNPNPRPQQPVYNPSLLTNMEKQQFAHAQASPFTHYNPNQHNSKSSKKQKQSHLNPNAPIYQGSSRKLPNFRNPNPQHSQNSHYTPHNENPPTAYFSHSLPAVPLPALPQPAVPITYQRRTTNIARTPELVNLSNVGKLCKMMKNVQPGMMPFVPQKGLVHGILMAGLWDNFVFYRGQNYHSYLMGEFYANIVTKRGLNDVFVLHTVVNKKNLLIDGNTIARALKIDIHTHNQPCINIYSTFKFNQNEFELFIGFFCDSDVPAGVCVENCGISFKHFLPIYQQLAIILRANIIPKPKNEQYFDFVDLKVMFQLVTNKVEFNLPYLIIMNMFFAFQLDFMPFGLLLTSIFDLYHIPMPRTFAERVEYFNIEELVVPKAPLADIKPIRFIPENLPLEIASHDYIRENELLKLAIVDLKIQIDDYELEVRALKEDNKDILAKLVTIQARVAFLEGINNKGKGKAIMIHDLEERDLEIRNEILVKDLVSDNLVEATVPEIDEFDDKLGFVAAVNLASEN